MKAKLITIACLLITLISVVGCGGKSDGVSIFIMPSSGMQQEVAVKLTQSLQAQVGDKVKVNVSTTPVFSMDRMFVEVASVGPGVIILPIQKWKELTEMGDTLTLDDEFNLSNYPSGVLELDSDSKNGAKEKHLFGIPVAHTKWLQDNGYKGEELYAFINPRTKHIDQAKQVLKAIAGN